MPSVMRALAVLLLLLPAAPARGQDTSAFLEHPPEAGSWANYRITTRKEGGQERSKPFHLAIVAQSREGAEPTYTLEVGPSKLGGYSDGTLRLVLKREPAPEEVLNPFLQASSVAYQEPGGEPFLLSASALRTLHDQARKAEVRRERTELGTERVADARGNLHECTKVRVKTTRSARLFFKSWTSVEEGVYWFSASTPFLIVRAELDVAETSGGRTKKKRVVILLKESGPSGATTKFSAAPTRERGLLGVIFH